MSHRDLTSLQENPLAEIVKVLQVSCRPQRLVVLTRRLQDFSDVVARELPPLEAKARVRRERAAFFFASFPREPWARWAGTRSNGTRLRSTIAFA